MIQIKEGFTPWYGEQYYPPLTMDTKVRVQFRNGEFDTGPAGDYWWERDDEPRNYDIVAYRKV